MKTNLIKISICLFLIGAIFTNCSKSTQELDEYVAENQNTTTLKGASAWQRIYTENFSSTTSLNNNWYKTNRKDYNSTLCQYVSSNPKIQTVDNKSSLVLTATKEADWYWESGHVKSKKSFKPGWNKEIRISTSIKLVAKDGNNWKGFSDTYGLWPAFWTTNEGVWPQKGEIDAMEGYSEYGNTHFASNLFYGKDVGTDQLKNSVVTGYSVSEGWHKYEIYWKNKNGWVTVTIKRDGSTVASYDNNDHSKLKLENFAGHNIIFNLNVGCTAWDAFDNRDINVLSQSMMWVDYVRVDERSIW